MKKITPFSQENLNEIFKISSKKPDRIISRESSNLEFKESFGYLSLPKYLKTCAAFANNRGGHIVFGIGRSPHKLIGLSGDKLKNFEALDPEKLTGHFNNYFTPEINWDIHLYELNKKTFGLLYIHEAKDKPIICKKEHEKDHKEGDIYYRYRGRTERIKYSELNTLLNEKREREQRLWMKHMANIARIGVREAGIFDLQTGKVTGTEGAFLIEESLLSQLSFIKEGEFSEVKGKPALKLIGEAETIGSLSLGTGGKQVIRTKGIRIADIILAVLHKKKIPEPDEYIKQICFENTCYLPIHYYINLQNSNVEKTLELINGVMSRAQAKSRLVKRLKEGKTQFSKLSTTDTPSSNQKKKFTQQIKNHEVSENLKGKELEKCLQAIRGLTAEEIKKHSKYIREKLIYWFNKHYSSAEGTIADNLRRTICWVDEALFMAGIK